MNKKENTEFSFYANTGEAKTLRRWLEEDLKPVTLRITDYKFDRGARLTAKISDGSETEYTSLVAISTERQKLNLTFPAILLMDGFMSADEAAGGLQPYYRDRGIAVTPESEATRVVTLSEDTFKVRTPAERKILTTLPVEELLRQEDFRDLFFPSLYFWLTTKYGVQNLSYPRILESMELVTPRENVRMRMSYYKYEDAVNPLVKQEYFKDFLLAR